MSTINSWKAFIKAQEVFVNQYAEPFCISYRKTDKEGLAHFVIEQKDPLENILPSLKRSFPGILEHDINTKDGYLLYDSTQIPFRTPELREVAAENYFEFDYKPCFSGYIKIKKNSYKWVEEICGQIPTTEGQVNATLADIKHIDAKVKGLNGFTRAASIGAVLRVQPSDYYATKQYELAHSYLTQKLGLDSVSRHGHFANLVIQDIFLEEAALNFIKENTAYQKFHHRVIFSINKSAFEEFEKTRIKKGIYYSSEENNLILSIKELEGLRKTIDLKKINPKLKGINTSELNIDLKAKTVEFERIKIVLPDCNSNEFHVTFSSKISLADLRFEISHNKKIFERYFGIGSLDVKHQQIFQLDRNVFLKNLETAVIDEQFDLNIDKEVISFDFTTESELNSALERLTSIAIAEIDFKGTEHRFKVKLEYSSALLSIHEKLVQIPAIKTKLESDGLKLSFFCFFDNHDLLQLLVSKIKDVVDPLLNENLEFQFEELQAGKLKYFLNYKKAEFEADIKSKFHYLRGEEISVCGRQKPSAFGTILKLNYPTIVIDVETEKDVICVPNVSLNVCCTLKGERDKIKRLSDTIDIIFSNSKKKLLNENLRSILTDSSKATSFPGEILRTPEYAGALEQITRSLLSKNINPKQIEAIAKCLLAKDFFIIQGPPGTGKSTAIAELIWQHIRINLDQKEPFRILVTSETNLAVDNALDKLRSKNHMLIKPIRFGSEDKLDKEGRRFSLESLKQWVTLGNEVLPADSSATNILQNWITTIGNRSLEKMTTDTSGLTKRWISYLTNSDDELRILFYEKYIKHVNVIGATCSSIGKLNSENKFTRFFSDYCSIVHTKEYNTFRASANKYTIRALKEKDITFDLVVQDEASKASPPELALPCLYSKKAVIIGDHRQLPPMIDTNEFIDSLKMISKKTKDTANRDEIDGLISYIKDNKAEFSISHFEKLFKSISTNLKSTFNVQYRMHPAINETVKQFYIEDGGLECGIPPDIADSEDMKHPLNRFHGVTSNRNTHVIWLDVNSPEIKSGTSRVNYGEVQAVDWLLSYFQKSSGFKKFVDFWPPGETEQKQIGIITFYGAQSGLLNKLIHKYPDVPLRISPVDRFQGMERNIVIVSLVRSNSIAGFPNQVPDLDQYPESGFPSQESLGFAEFPNRLNVALSRAKRLLIVVGNSKHFRKHPIYNQVYETIQNHPNGAIKVFDVR